jgi:hypothetical protein
MDVRFADCVSDEHDSGKMALALQSQSHGRRHWRVPVGSARGRGGGLVADLRQCLDDCGRFVRWNHYLQARRAVLGGYHLTNLGQPL